MSAFPRFRSAQASRKTANSGRSRLHLIARKQTPRNDKPAEAGLPFSGRKLNLRRLLLLATHETQETEASEHHRVGFGFGDCSNIVQIQVGYIEVSVGMVTVTAIKGRDKKKHQVSLPLNREGIAVCPGSRSTDGHRKLSKRTSSCSTGNDIAATLHISNGTTSGNLKRARTGSIQGDAWHFPPAVVSYAPIETDG